MTNGNNQGNILFSARLFYIEPFKRRNRLSGCVIESGKINQ